MAFLVWRDRSRDGGNTPGPAPSGSGVAYQSVKTYGRDMALVCKKVRQENAAHRIRSYNELGNSVAQKTIKAQAHAAAPLGELLDKTFNGEDGKPIPYDPARVERLFQQLEKDFAKAGR